MKYVAYYRVSSKQQGKSGLGLQGQKSTVINYLKGETPVKEFTDVETGTSKGNDRKGLNEAINYCKQFKCTLVISKIDRLSRSLSFISQLMDSDIEFVACDLPSANRFTIHIFSALAEQEARFISERTKVALNELKKKGVKLGTPENLTNKAREKGLEVRMQNALDNENNRKATLLIVNLREKGNSFHFIANKLNEYGYRTRRGCNFSRTQTKRLYDRYTANFEA